MQTAGIKALSISALKMILFQNHVNARLIIEKGDLVDKVVTLVEDERREREERRAREEEEMMEIIMKRSILCDFLFKILILFIL